MTFPGVFRKLVATSALCIVAATCMGFGGPGLVAPAVAAPDDSIINIPDVLQLDAGVSQPFPLSVVQGDTVPKNARLLISGLPSNSALSAGRLFTSGTWALRLVDLDGLKIEMTPAAAGTIQVTVSVVTLEGQPVAERTVSLTVGRADDKPDEGWPGSATSVEPSAAPSVAPRVAPSPPPAPKAVLLPDDLRRLMKQGDSNLVAGKVQVARLFYRRAAEQGWAPGALAMARSYDPQELAKITIVGASPADVALAKQWYEKAKALGSAEADGSLKRLSER